MLDNYSLRLLFKLAIVLYAGIVVSSLFYPRFERSEILRDRIRGWPRWFIIGFSLVGIAMFCGLGVGLVGLILGWSPARWIFAASILLNISGAFIMPVTPSANRWDAFRREFEPFLAGSIVATSFVAVDVLF